MRLRLDGGRDAGQSAEVLGQIEAAIVAPLEGRQIAGRVLRITRAQRALDGALDVAEAGVDPLEVVALGAATAVIFLTCFIPASSSPLKQPSPSLSTRDPGSIEAIA